MIAVIQSLVFKQKNLYANHTNSIRKNEYFLNFVVNPHQQNKLNDENAITELMDQGTNSLICIGKV